MWGEWHCELRDSGDSLLHTVAKLQRRDSFTPSARRIRGLAVESPGHETRIYKMPMIDSAVGHTYTRREGAVRRPVPFQALFSVLGGAPIHRV